MAFAPTGNNPSMMQRALAVLAMTVAIGATGVGGSAAQAAVRCQDVAAGGERWYVAQAYTNCRFARYAVRLAVERDRSPAHWRCYVRKSREFDPAGVPNRVRCYRGSKRVLGLLR
jgi:hypothetical protein